MTLQTTFACLRRKLVAGRRRLLALSCTPSLLGFCNAALKLARRLCLFTGLAAVPPCITSRQSPRVARIETRQHRMSMQLKACYRAVPRKSKRKGDFANHSGMRLHDTPSPSPLCMARESQDSGKLSDTSGVGQLHRILRYSYIYIYICMYISIYLKSGKSLTNAQSVKRCCLSDCPGEPQVSSFERGTCFRLCNHTSVFVHAKGKPLLNSGSLG